MVNHLIPLDTTWPASLGTSSGGWGGNRFNATEDATTVGALGWRRGDTTGPAPTTLRLRDTVTGTDVATVSTVPDNGAIGWQYADLPTPVSLVTGRLYLVAGTEPNGFHVFRLSGHATPEAPFAWEDSQYGSSYPSSEGGLSDESAYSVADGPAAGDPTGGGTTGSGDPVLTGDLAAWLSTAPGINQHQDDGLPWQTLAQLTDGDHGLAAIAANIGAIMGSSWTSATDTLHKIGTNILAGTGAVLDAVNDGLSAINDGLSAIESFLHNPSGGGAGALANNPPLPGAGWAMVGEADFDHCDVVTVQAHLIVLELATFPVDLPQVNRCGVPMRYRAGWWTPMNGDFAGERRFVDFEKSHLQDAGRLMNGALIVCQPGTSGHWQAWLLS